MVQKKLVALCLFLLICCGSPVLATTETNRDIVALLVKEKTHSNLAAQINQYIADVEARFPVDIRLVTGSWASASDVRACLKHLYKQEKLSGAVLVGDIPMHRFYMHAFANPNPLYYEDFDLVFKDNNNDGISDAYTGKPNLKIWVANLRTAEREDDPGIEKVKTVFAKTHEYYEGRQKIERRALAVTASDWPDGADEFAQKAGYRMFGKDGVDVLSNEHASVEALRSAFARHTYMLFYIQVHSSEDGQGMEHGDLNSREIAEIETGALFILNHGCTVCNWCKNAAAGSSTNTGMAWVFGKGKGQALVGNVRSGMIYGQDQLLERLLAGDYVGKAYYAAKISAEDEMHREYPSGDVVSGVTFIGNPFLYMLSGCVSATTEQTGSAAKSAACSGETNAPTQSRYLVGTTISATLTGLVVLMKFKEQEGMKLPSSKFVSDALNMQIGDYYGHVTGWRVQPMVFIVTEYFTPSKGFNSYDWWISDNWENHFNLLREVGAGIARGTIMVRAKDGTVAPVNLAAFSRSANGRVLSVGTTYFVDDAGSGGVVGRANGNADFWPQTPEEEAVISNKFGCRLASYSSGFIPGTYGRFEDPGSVDVGAQIHEIGHEFLEWPDIAENCYGYSDWEIVKRISTVNKSGPSCIIRELNGAPDGSTVSVAVGDWDVWGFRNIKNPTEYIVFENVSAKGYSLTFCNEHPDKHLLVFGLNTKEQTQVNVENLAGATWEDGSPVGFTISDVSGPGDVMSFKIKNSTPGAPRNCGTASGIQGYPVELYEQSDGKGRVGAFSAYKYLASWMPRMGIEPATALSIRILPGYKVTLCEGRRLDGRACVLSNTRSRAVSIDLSTHQFDRKTSSLLVEAISADNVK